MAVPIFAPRRDADLLTWSANFDAQINTSPAAYGLTVSQATAYATLHAAWADAYRLAKTPGTNSKAAVIAKDLARETLLNGPGGAWELVRFIQALPTTTDEMRGELGLRVRDTELTPVPPPRTAPSLSVLWMSGRQIRLRLHDEEHPERRGKPPGVEGAVVLYHVGDAAPADPMEWRFGRLVSKPEFEITMPYMVEAGSLVWLTAFWFTARKESSPCARPQSARVGDGVALAA